MQVRQQGKFRNETHLSIKPRFPIFVVSTGISTGCSLEGMMLKLKLQYLCHLMRRVDSLEKTDAGRDLGQEEKGKTEDKKAG